MAKLSIPERFKSGISSIEKLDESIINSLYQGFQRAPESISAKELASAIQSEHKDISVEYLQNVIKALREMYAVRSNADIPLESFANDIVEAVEENEKTALSIERAENFKQRIIKLLSIDTLGLHSKARDLQTEDERTFCRARILTDLRPVFGNQIGDGPKGMTLIHILKLGYHSGSKEHLNFYVSLDSEDLVSLKEAIDRALAKAESLKENIDGFPFLGLK